MRVIIREEADADLDAIFSWIAKDNPRAAADMIRRIRARIGQLVGTGFAEMGRSGRAESTRELVEGPYVGQDRDELVVLAVFHGAQDR